MAITDIRHIFSLFILLAITLVILRLFLKRTIRTAKLKRWWRLISDRFHEHQFLKVPEFNDNFQENQLFRRVSLYLNSLESIEDSDYTNLFSGEKSADIFLSLNANQTVHDEFLGAYVSWTFLVPCSPNDASADVNNKKSFVLRIRKRDKRRILRPYLQHIHSVSEEIDQTRKDIRLYTNSGDGGGRWRSVAFTHPATMDTVAMEAEVKSKIKADLDVFLKSKSYYHRLGRVWRRSYLLYGPSGTGKSSFVAAMAKTLSYDVYDLDLSKVAGDSELKRLLLQTNPRSLVLVEDLDRYVSTTTLTSPQPAPVTPVMLQGIMNRPYEATSPQLAPVTLSLSGIMNFMDGVVNSCCDDRVMVFTMTTKDNIDPAILRPGRVDVHIYFPLCDFNNFKNLASSYLGVKEHKLFPQVEEIFLNNGATMSHAEISELMMANRSSPSRALKCVISALQSTSKSGARPSGDESPESVNWRSKDGHGVKEIKKLYGLLTRKKSLRNSGSFDIGT